MTESTATKVGVPGDKRLGDLKVNKPVHGTASCRWCAT